MKKKWWLFFKILFVAIILCITMLNSIPQNTYAKEQPTVVKEFPYKPWITYGDTIKLKGSTVTKQFGIKDKNVKVTFSSYQRSRLKISKNGLMLVKKPDNTCKNVKVDEIQATFTYKGKKYVLKRKFIITYEYDDNHPASYKDVTPDQIKRFKKAYKTGNTGALNSREKQAFKNVKKAVNYAKSGKNRYEKLKKLNDWITQNVTYDYSRADVSYTFYGVLVKKRGVCEGYANAFKLCASVMGISCENVIGYIGRNSSVGHEWNIVKLEDGKWYHIDVTFNDTGTKNKYCGTTYKYFCLTDEQMKAADHRWYDRKKCNGKKYTVANYEKKYFIDSEKGLYDAVKQAVKEKKEFVHFFILTSKIDNYPSFPEINSEYASIYVGRNVNIQRIDTCRHSIPDYLAPNKKSYIMFLYQITYPSNNKVTQWQYVDNNQDMEQMLKDAVAQGQTSIKVVLVSSDVLLDGFCAPEISYKLLGKYVTIVIPCEEDIPTFLTKGKGQYTRYEIVIDYSEANSSVYNVTTDTEIRGAFENAIAKKETKIYLYSPNHSEDQIRDISIDYSCYSEEVKNIHISRSSYNYMDPYTGKVMTPFWTEVEITYR